MDRIIKLSPRLLCAASFVRPGARVIDVGTDHAYIPLWLLQNGIASFAAGSDINEGPLSSASQNARECGLADRLNLYLSDGLRGCDCEHNNFDHVIICGMGGELISAIISESPLSETAGVRFILQPMTMADKLRKYLTSHGFLITDESITSDAGKFYQCIVCEYVGENYELSPIEALVGRINILKRNKNPVFYEYMDSLCKIYRNKISGMKLGGEDCTFDEAVLFELENLLSEGGERS